MNLEFTAVNSKVHCSEADSEDTAILSPFLSLPCVGASVMLNRQPSWSGQAQQTSSCPTLEWNTHRITEGELGQALLLKRKSRREYDGSVVDCR
ncbi:unnamed protein product [Arctogadus glacialis]